MNDLLQALIAAAIAAIPVLIGVAIRLLKAWSDAKIAAISNDDLRVRVALARDAILDGVSDVNQTMAPLVREAAADGVLGLDERKTLRAAAKVKARHAFSAAWWTKLREDLELQDDDDFDQWLDTLIEHAVTIVKGK